MRFAALLVLPALLHAQPPAINQEGVFNSASRMPPSLPGGALAPGSRIIIEGLRFEPESEVKLGDRKLRVLSSAPARIEALLPPALPPGRAAIQVTNRDGVSRPFEVRIAAANLGLYSANDKSWGPARMERPFVLSGTGLGAERHPEIFVGGRRAKLIRAGPHPSDPGVDEIEFSPAAGSPEGCFVPILARLPNGQVSNTVAAAIGRCAPPDLRGDMLLLLARVTARIRPYGLRDVDVTQDYGAAVFAPEPAIATLLNAWRLLPPPGTCTAYTGKFSEDANLLTTGSLFAGAIGAGGHDHGKTVTIRGAKNNETLPRSPDTPGYYAARIGVDKPIARPGPPLFLSPGDYKFEWSGGSATLAMPAPFSWNNASRLDALDRAAGFTVEWRNSSAPRIGIVAVSVNPDTTAMGAAICVADASTQRFRVPPETLANLPPTAREPGLPLSLVMLAPLPELTRSGTGLSIATTVRAESVRWR
jgi:hypothetical protein